MNVLEHRIDDQSFSMALKAKIMKNEVYAVSTSNETVHLFYSVSIVQNVW